MISLLLWFLCGPNIIVKAADFAEEGGGFVSDEVIAEAESLAHAEVIAAFYKMELKSYTNGIAVFGCLDPKREVSVSRVRRRSAGMPELSLNRIYSIQDTYLPPDTSMQYHHAEVDTPAAWKYSTGKGVTVAVVDTGINTEHAEFEGRILANSYNSVSGVIGFSDIQDNHGHGTHVCGIIGARLDDYNKVCGVAPDSRLMVIKACDEENQLKSGAVLRAINYAADNGADIINLSMGRSYFDENGKIDGDEIEHNIIINAVNKGVVVVCAAGNSKGNRAMFPAAYPEAIAVSAVKQGKVFDDSYSNYGPEIDFSAPGTKIYSTNIGGNSYAIKNGTSMASPVVAGVAALIKSLNPDYTPKQIKNAMVITATDMGDPGWDKFYGYGVVNSYSSLLLDLPLKGDCNGDGKIDAKDLTFIKMFLLGRERYNPVMDLNRDGKVDIADLSYLKRNLAGIQGFGLGSY
jgi:subtilisin family serine protease